MLVVSVVVVGGLGSAAYRPAMNYWAARNRTLWRTAKVEQGQHRRGRELHRHRQAEDRSLGRLVHLRADSGTLLRVQSGGQEGRLAGEDRSALVSGVRRARPGDAGHAAGRRAPRAVAAPAGDQRRKTRHRSCGTGATRSSPRPTSTSTSSPACRWRPNCKISQATVDQAKASLETSLANLNYAEIRSPVDGIVINRKIDPGQTVAAQFQTPELFIVAPDMRKEMHVHASVDEADIGLIKQAQKKKYPVTFTVDAYPDKLFSGTILEIRLNSTTEQNVVTYPVVVSTPNPNLDLLPGMTASLSFQVDQQEDVVKIPNAALRFYPVAKQVRPEDVPILEGPGRAEIRSQRRQPALAAGASPSPNGPGSAKSGSGGTSGWSTAICCGPSRSPPA